MCVFVCTWFGSFSVGVVAWWWAFRGPPQLETIHDETTSWYWEWVRRKERETHTVRKISTALSVQNSEEEEVECSWVLVQILGTCRLYVVVFIENTINLLNHSFSPMLTIISIQNEQRTLGRRRNSWHYSYYLHASISTRFLSSSPSLFVDFFLQLSLFPHSL